MALEVWMSGWKGGWVVKPGEGLLTAIKKYCRWLIAQMVEWVTVDPRVRGSNPVRSIIVNWNTTLQLM